ncbi:MAG: DNA polymerase ligase N-terminal domain-containing protein [Pirellulales bacterium]
MPRFVLLEHAPGPAGPQALHWDLMLEVDGVLWTWALSRLPAITAGTIEAQRLPDHRLAYLDYEGPISGGRGMVTRIAGGGFDLLSQTDDELRVKLIASSCNGIATLRHDASESSRWWFDLTAAEPDCPSHPGS